MPQRPRLPQTQTLDLDLSLPSQTLALALYPTLTLTTGSKGLGAFAEQPLMPPFTMGIYLGDNGQGYDLCDEG